MLSKDRKKCLVKHMLFSLQLRRDFISGYRETMVIKQKKCNRCEELKCLIANRFKEDNLHSLELRLANQEIFSCRDYQNSIKT